ncbi:MAG: hypothetical protein ACRYGA_05205 [Janthinobacterium lividum]
MRMPSLYSTPSALVSQRVATSEPPTDGRPSAKKFTRDHAPSARSTNAFNATSAVRDKGGIAPNNTTYDSAVPLANEALSFWPIGASWNSAIKLGPVNAERSGFHALRIQGVGNEIHTSVQQNGVVLHNLGFFRGMNSAAQIDFDGQLLTPNSPTDHLEIARSVAFEAASA